MTWPATATSLLLAANLRADSRRRGQLLLTLAGICLGVAVVVGIDLASESARQSFARSVSAVSAQATHRLRTLDGRLPEHVYVAMRRELGLRSAVPVVQGRAIAAADPRFEVEIIGTDFLAGASLTTSGIDAQMAGVEDAGRLMSEPGAVLVSPGFLDTRGDGDIRLVFPQPGYALTIAGQTADSALPPDSVLADISTAQQALGMLGSLTRVDLWLNDDEAAVLSAWLPAGVFLETAEQALSRVDELSKSFRINLQALALLALLVGALLVFSTVAYSVVRRRRQFGILRCMGMRRTEIVQLVLMETFVLAAIGSLAGVLAGVFLGAGLVDLFTRTLSDLYAPVTSAYTVNFGGAVKGLVLGIGVSLVSGLAPALEAASADPRHATLRVEVERRSARAVPYLGTGAVLLALAGAVILAAEPDLSVAFAGIFLVIIACALATPLFGIVLLRGIGAIAGRWDRVQIAYAARNIGAGLSRTGPAMAALAIAVAAAIGIGVMVTSFRISFSSWLTQTIDADISVRIARDAGWSASDIDSVTEAVSAIAGVSDVALVQRVALPDGQGLARLHATRPARLESGWPVLRTSVPDWQARFHDGDGVLVSESYATRTGLTEGKRLELVTRAGPRKFDVLGVFIDYTTDRGVVAIELDAYRHHWQDHSLSSIGIHVASGQLDAVLAAANRLAAERPWMAITSGETIRRISLAVFDRTFRITDVLRLLAALVALLAVANALSARLLDNGRELTLLRAQGLSNRRMLALVSIQNLLFGAVTGLAAIGPGYLLAWLLIEVVNRIAFGWRMEFVADPVFAVQGLALAVVAAVIAGTVPMLRSARDNVRPELQQE